MRISIDWLKDFIKLSNSTEEISDILTMIGLESEKINNLSNIDGVIIAEVVKKIKHPNADKLSLCQVNDGKKSLSVVCGAPNVDTGQKVAFAPVGTTLPGNLIIKKAKIRGEISEGMICSERELEISDEHEGIMVLNHNAKVGSTFIDYMSSLSESLELDITPNRPDCFSHLGVARDISVKLNKKVKPINTNPKKYTKNEVENLISINIENADDCPRYIAGIVKNVKVDKSPKWLVDRLESIGQRSINNLVDISNFVMMEMGHPTHIFDYDQIESNEILIRRGSKNESIKTLDEVDRKLSPNELLITNGKKPIAVAGIMGGLNSAVSEKTKTILIESAYFDPPTIRKSAKALGMSTDASKRFERGADVNGAAEAFWRVISLIEDYSIGEWVEGLIDVYPKPFKEKKIILTKEKLDILSGVDIDDLFIKTTLIQLGFKINSNSKGKWTCIPPSWRPDIEREVDVIEELIRFYGYDKVPSRYHYESIMNASDPDPHKYLDDVISIMAGLGFSQVFNNSLQSKNTVSLLDYDPVHIMNPLSDKMNRMRNSLLPGLLENIDFNLKNAHPDTMLFEWGNVFEQKSKGLKGIVEKLHLSAVIHGYLNKTSVHRNKARKCDFGVIRGLFSNLMQRLNVNNITFSSNENSSFGFINSLSIHADNQKLGEIGKINPKFSKTMNLDNDDAYGFQLDLELLMSLAKNISTYNSIITFPLIERDLNFIVDEQILAGELISSVKKNGTSLLKSAQPVNVFRHSSLGNNKKSITINMIFQSPTKTLEDKDVNPIIDKIIQVVSKKYSAKLR